METLLRPSKQQGCFNGLYNDIRLYRHGVAVCQVHEFDA